MSKTIKIWGFLTGVLLKIHVFWEWHTAGGTPGNLAYITEGLKRHLSNLQCFYFTWCNFLCLLKFLEKRPQKRSLFLKSGLATEHQPQISQPGKSVTVACHTYKVYSLKVLLLGKSIPFHTEPPSWVVKTPVLRWVTADSNRGPYPDRNIRLC
jgi:hypothetical protein